jgi:hypothetical protein
MCRYRTTHYTLCKHTSPALDFSQSCATHLSLIRASIRTYIHQSSHPSSSSSSITNSRSTNHTTLEAKKILLNDISQIW